MRRACSRYRKWALFPSPPSRTVHVDACPTVFGYEYQERLDPLWGAKPHRISHSTAMRMTLAPLRLPGLLRVSGPAVPPVAAERLNVVAYEEFGDSLFVGARHTNGATWVSEPSRALLECLKGEDNVADGDLSAALVIKRSAAGSARRAVDLAGRLGWDKPLRRLASIAARIDDCEWLDLPADQRPLLNVPATLSGAGWIALGPYDHGWAAGEPAFQDHRYRVVWWTHPDDFLKVPALVRNPPNTG